MAPTHIRVKNVDDDRDGKVFTITYQDAMQSGILKDLISDFEDASFVDTIPLTGNISDHTLSRIISWLMIHSGDVARATEQVKEFLGNPQNRQPPTGLGMDEDAVNKALSSQERTLVAEKLKTLTPWDVQFFEVPTDEVFDILIAANYLDIQRLVNIASQTVANMIKGKTTEQIRDLFGIVNDFTPEEEDELRRTEGWALPHCDWTSEQWQ
ncbi:Skp1 family, dimerization domain-containing protein [Lasiosphaeria miniovina]|uniref:E3 ubiquitin ligase complex SCF subunit n=1 Tax=Lasiosphaeria miniovina TaxID=1954250 RepID=A0AA40ACD3_9PEZI|nr:Skp1 family, dimerization domain-containing protein [Lasiosphaeria miniovina]KAK0713295.1 Skp1 family, dimerization domain-containing protein [Lasiosphaeria miniovina]